MNARPTAEDLARLSDLAPEVASAVPSVAGDIAFVVGDEGVVRAVADGPAPLHPNGQGWVGKLWANVARCGWPMPPAACCGPIRPSWTCAKPPVKPGSRAAHWPMRSAAVGAAGEQALDVAALVGRVGQSSLAGLLAELLAEARRRAEVHLIQTALPTTAARATCRCRCVRRRTCWPKWP